jgi:hypothetical protein
MIQWLNDSIPLHGNGSAKSLTPAHVPQSSLETIPLLALFSRGDEAADPQDLARPELRAKCVFAGGKFRVILGNPAPSDRSSRRMSDGSETTRSEPPAQPEVDDKCVFASRTSSDTDVFGHRRGDADLIDCQRANAAGRSRARRSSPVTEALRARARKSAARRRKTLARR